jgi:LysM repeat protein
MQITHEEARTLIQFSLEQVLKSQEKNLLQIHLEDCSECRTFFDDIKEVENLLLPAMLRHWDLEPTPHSVGAVTKKSKSQLQSSIILATRTAIISIVFAAFVFSAWQLTQSGKKTVNSLPVGILPVPTPSSQSTSTQVSLQNCVELVYRVQEKDTLKGIAAKFSVSKDRLMAINNLDSESLTAKKDLLIPICHSTPTGTVHPSTLTTTFTPLLGPTMSTPNG